jgi:hypothetical protein
VEDSLVGREMHRVGYLGVVGRERYFGDELVAAVRIEE